MNPRNEKTVKIEIPRAVGGKAFAEWARVIDALRGAILATEAVDCLRDSLMACDDVQGAAIFAHKLEAAAHDAATALAVLSIRVRNFAKATEQLTRSDEPIIEMLRPRRN